MTDSILAGMADELRAALVKAGADPKDPPSRSMPPSGAAYAEYKRRGGDSYTDPDEFTEALVAYVSAS